jgi:hypothetical protein
MTLRDLSTREEDPGATGPGRPDRSVTSARPAEGLNPNRALPREM